MSIYIINSPILTDYGDWQFTGPVSVTSARNLLAHGFISAIGHDSSATFLSQLLGYEIKAQRQSIQMQAGDQALVLRLKSRLPEGQILTATQLAQLPYELGILKRLK